MTDNGKVKEEVVVEEEQQEIDLEYAFLVFKTKNGDYGVKQLEEFPKTDRSDDIYAAMSAILRLFDAQQVAQMVGNAMLQTALAQQQQQGRTKGGVVIPDNLPR